MQSPHIVKPVGKFHQQHANVIRHRKQEFSEIFRLLGVFAVPFKLGKFGHTIDKGRNFIAKER